MTISTAVPKVAYTGNGTTTVFPVPFEFFVNSDLYVREWTDYINNPTVFTTLVYGTDYTVTGGNGTTGSVTLTVAPTSGSHLEIADNVPFGQVVQYQAFGPFPAEAHERALDRLAVQIKQVANSVSDAVGGNVSVISIFGRNGSVTAQQADYSLFYSLNTHIHAWSEITAKPTLFPPEAHTHDWAVILNKPTTFPPSGHTHTWGEITDAVEQAQDLVATMFVHAGDTGITFTYDDATGLVYASVTGGSGGSSPILRNYNYSSNTSMVTDPGINNFRMNNANYLTTTQMTFSNIDLDGLSPDLGSLQVDDVLMLSNLSAAGYGRYTITALDHTPSGYSLFTVVCDTNNTAAGGPTNNNDFQIQLLRASTGLGEAPNDGVAYARKSLNWTGLTWNDVAGKPTTFTPAVHTHPQSEVTNLVADLSGKANTVHLHVTSDVTGLDTALSGKAATVHTHTIANVTGLQTALDAKETLGQVAGINTQAGATYTFNLSDKGLVVEGNSATAQTFTLPLNATAAFPVNSRIDLVQIGVGKVSIAATAGVTILSKGAKLGLSAQYAGATLYKRAVDTWLLVGDLG